MPLCSQLPRAGQPVAVRLQRDLDADALAHVVLPEQRTELAIAE
jgi:hypothetical protein